MRAVPPSDRAAELFPESGLAVITRGDLHVLIDAGPFGPGGAGHSHSDTLTITVRHGSREVLIDPGTYTYVADAAMRDAFRGSSAHNTMRVDGLDQADPVKPFRWENKPDVAVRQWVASEDSVYLDAECRYRTIVHRRRVMVMAASAIFVLDEIEGAGGEHLVEQFWHAGQPVTALSPNRLTIGDTGVFVCAPASPEIKPSWRSRAFAEKTAASMISVAWTAELPQMCATAFVFETSLPLADLSVERKGGMLTLSIPDYATIKIPAAGAPEVSRL